MDQSQILAFVKSTKNTFSTMLQLDVKVGEPALKKSRASRFDVSSIIAMTGNVEGSCVLSFDSSTAVNVVKTFTGMEFTIQDDDFTDAIGELANMVAGGAKSLFDTTNVTISTPTVVVGKGHIIHGHKDTVCIAIPCTCDCGEFAVEIALVDNKAKADANQAAANTSA